MTTIIRRAALAAAAVVLSTLSVMSLGAAPASAAQVSENDYFKSIDVILERRRSPAGRCLGAGRRRRVPRGGDAGRDRDQPLLDRLHPVRHPAELLVGEVPGRGQQGADPLYQYRTAGNAW